MRLDTFPIMEMEVMMMMLIILLIIILIVIILLIIILIVVIFWSWRPSAEVFPREQPRSAHILELGPSPCTLLYTPPLHSYTVYTPPFHSYALPLLTSIVHCKMYVVVCVESYPLQYKMYSTHINTGWVIVQTYTEIVGPYLLYTVYTVSCWTLDTC